MRYSYRAAKLCFALLFVLAVVESEARTIRPIVSTGMAVPGSGQNFERLRSSRLGDSGAVLFTGSVSSPGGSLLDGVWVHDGQQLTTLAISGDSLLGDFKDGLPLSIGPDGKVLFQVQSPFPSTPPVVANIPTNVVGYPGSLSVLRYDATLPADPSVSLGLIRYPVTSDQAFFASLLDGGLVTDRSGELAVVLPRGTRVNAGAEGLELRGVSSWQPPVVDDFGRFSFLGVAANSIPASSTSFGVIRETAEGLQQVARRGSTAPLIDSPFFLSFGDLQSNGAGHLTFSSSLADATGLRMNALWAVDQDGSLRLVASDSPRHPTSEGVYFRSRAIEPPPQAPLTQPDRPYGRVINEQGRVAFFAQYGNFAGGRCEQCLWSEGDGGQLEQVIAAGDSVDGAPGATFEGPFGFWPLAMNATGQHAIFARLTGAHTSALLLTDPFSGVLTAVVKSGDTLPVPDATGSLTPRVVEEVLGQGTDFLNDRGEALFYARFTDGTWGVFVASVPEPRSVMVAALGIAMSVMKQKSLGV